MEIARMTDTDFVILRNDLKKIHQELQQIRETLSSKSTYYNCNFSTSQPASLVDEYALLTC
jgi:hypothetical protein